MLFFHLLVVLGSQLVVLAAAVVAWPTRSAASWPPAPRSLASGYCMPGSRLHRSLITAHYAPMHSSHGDHHHDVAEASSTLLVCC